MWELSLDTVYRDTTGPHDWLENLHPSCLFFEQNAALRDSNLLGVRVPDSCTNLQIHTCTDLPLSFREEGRRFMRRDSVCVAGGPCSDSFPSFSLFLAARRRSGSFDRLNFSLVKTRRTVSRDIDTTLYHIWTLER
ncbi:hypothetical protein Mapa_012406 [Marchantia paleacea]|nr:hypothetical protein Mapa_012406 [Marchantia paleacea]